MDFRTPEPFAKVSRATLLRNYIPSFVISLILDYSPFVKPQHLIDSTIAKDMFL